MIEYSTGREDLSGLFNLRVDWTMAAYFYDKVYVELDRVHDHSSTLARFDEILDAISYAKRYLSIRGFTYTCDIDAHQGRNDTHITLHAKRKGRPEIIGPDVFYDPEDDEEGINDDPIADEILDRYDALRLMFPLENTDASD
jgi:hypothetical protein